MSPPLVKLPLQDILGCDLLNVLYAMMMMNLIRGDDSAEAHARGASAAAAAAEPPPAVAAALGGG